MHVTTQGKAGGQLRQGRGYGPIRLPYRPGDQRYDQHRTQAISFPQHGSSGNVPNIIQWYDPRNTQRPRPRRRVKPANGRLNQVPNANATVFAKRKYHHRRRGHIRK
nr:hypothetical protein [Cressdnaviricota sp.]UOF77877.1 hypothetical protein [Cressdnaviricota sp.]